MCDFCWSDPWGAASPTDVRERFHQAQTRPVVRRFETVQAGSVRFAQKIGRFGRLFGRKREGCVLFGQQCGDRLPGTKPVCAGGINAAAGVAGFVASPACLTQADLGPRANRQLLLTAINPVLEPQELPAR